MGGNAGSALTSGFLGVAIAFALGYLLFRLIKPKSKPSSSGEYGRQYWLNWLQ
tara:strand:- start:19 stop:177 length:159 start_codon:yes stop_codon:yes gene_type:complete